MVEQQGIFAELTGSGQRLVLPWSRTIEMCWKNLKNRRGRFILIFVSIAVVVAFFVSTLSFHSIVAELSVDPDVHTKAVLERGGLLSNDPDAETKARDQMIWLLILSGMLCFVGVTNTMYMSVTERYREIGTLKCLGALDTFVVRLFLIESIFIGVVGSTMGALAGCLLTLIQIGITLEFALIFGSHIVMPFVVGISGAVIGGTVLTVMAAIYPTLVAAKMKPVDAMRVEI